MKIQDYWIKRNSKSNLISIAVPKIVLAADAETAPGVPLGDGKTGLVVADLTGAGGKHAYYPQNATGETAITPVAATTLGTWQSGGWKEVDATNMPGIYQYGIPDVALAFNSATGVSVVDLLFHWDDVMLEAEDIVVRIHLFRSIAT